MSPSMQNRRQDDNSRMASVANSAVLLAFSRLAQPVIGICVGFMAWYLGCVVDDIKSMHKDVNTLQTTVAVMQSTGSLIDNSDKDQINNQNKRFDSQESRITLLDNRLLLLENKMHMKP